MAYQCGTWHDARVYRNSLTRNLVERLDGQNEFLLGDPAFGGFPNIRTTNSTNQIPLTREEANVFSRQRVIVENAFGLLKMKLKILRGCLESSSVEKNLRIIKSCIWLHNFFIKRLLS